MFLFLVHSVLVTLLRYSHIRIHCVTFYLPTNSSVNTQNACSSLLPIVSIRLASLPTSQRRKVRMLFEKRGKCHVSSDSQCFYVRSSSSDSFVVTYSHPKKWVTCVGCDKVFTKHHYSAAASRHWKKSKSCGSTVAIIYNNGFR